MPWNEPGSNNRDPWGGGGRDQGPPDLDEVFRRLTRRLEGLFGGKRGDGSGGRTGGPPLPIGSTRLWSILIIGALIVWALSGFYSVDEGKRGVELRFGRATTVTLPGLNYHLPAPVETVEFVDLEQIRTEEIGYRSSAGQQTSLRALPDEALMLTRDENIVDVRLSVQYKVKDALAYAFNVAEPEQTLRQVVESALREVVGRSDMDNVLTEGRSQIVKEVKELGQRILDQYGTGLEIVNVNLQDAQPPDDVQAAFADAIKAREDEQRFKNEAEAYRNEVVPRARGQAARRMQEAEAYKSQVVSQAEGETQRFEQLRGEYQKAPDITRERLYLDAMEAIMAGNPKIVMGAEQGNNVLYLPLDRLINKPSPATDTAREATPPSALPSATNASGDNRLRDTDRNRGGR